MRIPGGRGSPPFLRQFAVSPRPRPSRAPGRMPPPPPRQQLNFRQRLGAMRNIPPLPPRHHGDQRPAHAGRLGLHGHPLSAHRRLYVGKLIIDEAVRLVGAGVAGDVAECLAARPARPPDGRRGWNSAIGSDLLGRMTTYVDTLLSERFTNATSIRLMEHAAELDRGFRGCRPAGQVGSRAAPDHGPHEPDGQLFSQAGTPSPCSASPPPARRRALADGAAGGGTGTRLHRRIPLQRVELLAEFPVDAGNANWNTWRQIGECRDREPRSDLQPQPLFIERFRTLLRQVLTRRTGAPPRAHVWNGAAGAGHAGPTTWPTLHRLAHRARHFSIGDLTFLAGGFRRLRQLLESLLPGSRRSPAGAVPRRPVFLLRDRPRSAASLGRWGASADPPRLRVRGRRLPLRGQRALALRGLSFELHAGEVLAWSAKRRRQDHAGELLARLYDPGRGRIPAGQARPARLRPRRPARQHRG